MILSDSQEMLREATREFAQTRIAPFSRDWEAARHIPRATLDEMGEMGMLGHLRVVRLESVKSLAE